MIQSYILPLLNVSTNMYTAFAVRVFRSHLLNPLIYKMLDRKILHGITTEIAAQKIDKIQVIITPLCFRVFCPKFLCI